MGEIGSNGKTKILHLQFGSSPSGNYTIRQHEAFLEAGFDSKVLSLNSLVFGDPRIQKLGKAAKLRGRLNQHLMKFVTRKADKSYGLFSCSFIGSDIRKHPMVMEADLIYVHWVLGGFLSIKNLEQLGRLGKPMIIIMHDMWTITGGCSHSFDCQKFLTHCHNCPILPGDRIKDLSYRQFEEKRRFYEKYDHLFFVAPSIWLYNLAQKAALTRDKPIFHIPNVIDTAIFKPFDKNVAKKILNLEEKDFVIAFGANWIDSPYKGWKYLLNALQRLKEKNFNREIQILVFGSGTDDRIKNAIPFKVKFMGFVKDDYATNLIYNASDVFVVPSVADNLPTTILESLSCGTPVVGFSTGGIPDMIDHKVNGYLARQRDADDLADGIAYVMENNLEGQLKERFSRARFIQDHLDLISFINKHSVYSGADQV